MSGISNFPNFRNFQISGKSDNLERLTKIFEMNFAKISVRFDSAPEFPEFLVEWKAPCNLICYSMICVMKQLFWLCIFEQDVG